jgi:hypothetical protein
VTPCSLADVYHRLGGICCFHPKGKRVEESVIMETVGSSETSALCHIFTTYIVRRLLVCLKPLRWWELTNSMEPNSSCKTSIPPSAQFPNILWNPKVPYSVHKKSGNWSLSWTRWTQAIPPKHIPQRCILVLSSHIRLSFYCGFPAKTFYAFMFAPMHATRLVYLHNSNYIWWRVARTFT